ncbi:GNAT family N-acetyltransferase [Clostridium sp.]|uniref:GNAT family N-acetyltransferase n=1 Tax=Clostridium sp. TaxID=1506 RepID=UPI0039906C3E
MDSSNTIKIENIIFKTKSCTELTTDEIKKCSELFSNHYGHWAENSNKGIPGSRVKLGKKYYERFKTLSNYYVAMAFYNDKLIGHAFYLRTSLNNIDFMSWVLQLVVHTDYRKKGIAKTLLHSIWGFSGDKAWGLATSNPYTVKTLESATFRKVQPIQILKNLEMIKILGQKINFIDSEGYIVNEYNSIVNTHFDIDHSNIPKKIENAYGDNWKLGDLPPGYEWLAFTFRDQQPEFSQKQFDNLIEFSERQLKDAYSRMNMENQNWTKGTDNEVNFIINKLNLTGNENIVDFGCGVGRHSINFAEKNFNSVLGIDFATPHITTAIEKSKAKNLSNIQFKESDCRNVKLNKLSDLIICLYDVIGSFPKAEDNIKILYNIYHALRNGGYAVISVMNMELTEDIAIYRDDILKNPISLLNLKPSSIMQKTGDIFDPEYFLIDTRTNLVFRKEQFSNDNGLSAEHVIRDKRYTKEEISSIVKQIGFTILDIRFVQAGKWDHKLSSTDKKAKEILLFLQK